MSFRLRVTILTAAAVAVAAIAAGALMYLMVQQQIQASFDDTLKSFLGKDQWKRYDKWRSDQRKRAEQDRRERWGQSPGGPEPT